MRPLSWIATGTLVVLASRAVVYAMSPSPLASTLSHETGGPALPVVTLVSLVLALVVAAVVLWLAALGVRERQLLETRVVLSPPRLRPQRVVVHALVMWPATMLAFALLESTIHWRAGLGWHGLHCLTGPVHRNAIPVLAAFSLLAAAIVAALDHVLAWMRRLVALIARPRLAWAFPAPPRAPSVEPCFASVRLGASGARAPPLPV
jgi:hypothetical protein